jgi:hypothetical protein
MNDDVMAQTEQGPRERSHEQILPMARMTAVDRLIDVPRQHATERSLDRFNVTAVFGEAFGQSFDLAARDHIPAKLQAQFDARSLAGINRLKLNLVKVDDR